MLDPSQVTQAWCHSVSGAYSLSGVFGWKFQVWVVKLHPFDHAGLIHWPWAKRALLPSPPTSNSLNAWLRVASASLYHVQAVRASLPAKPTQSI